MSDAAITAGTEPIRLPAIPLGDVYPWAVLMSLLVVLAVYFVGAEQGATSLIGGSMVHELVHDARHLLGFPCH
jgi:hypothetical protein